jgi:peptidoglycan hydrolase CwlO-like protein
MTREDRNYVAALVEDINSKFDLLVEIVVPMQKDVAVLKEDMKILKKDMREVKADIKTLQTALTATNKDIRGHGRRITRLEASSA